MQYIVTIAFIGILFSLAFALFYMLKGGQNQASESSSRMAKALAMRIGISVVLFLCILISWQMGWIEPSGIRAGQ